MTCSQGQGGGAGGSKGGRKSTAVMSSAAVHTCNSSPCETEAGGSPAPNQPRLQREMVSKKKKKQQKDNALVQIWDVLQIPVC